MINLWNVSLKSFCDQLSISSKIFCSFEINHLIWTSLGISCSYQHLYISSKSLIWSVKQNAQSLLGYTLLLENKQNPPPGQNQLTTVCFLIDFPIQLQNQFSYLCPNPVILPTNRAVSLSSTFFKVWHRPSQTSFSHQSAPVFPLQFLLWNHRATSTS